MNVEMRGTTLLWLAMAIFMATMVLLLRNILTPFIAALILAYIFDPLVRKLQRLKLTRLAATFLVIAVVILAIMLVLTLLIPLLVTQTSEFISSLPALIKALQNYASEEIKHLQNTAFGPILAERLRNFQNPLDPLLNEAATLTAHFLSSLWAGGQALFGALSFVVVTPIMACYLLYDWDNMISVLHKLVPRRDEPYVRSVMTDINLVLAAYLRGQALVCLLLGLIYAVGLTAVGLKFSLLLGIGAGLIAFIPYLGNIISALTALLVALAQFGPEPAPLLEVIAVFIVGQLVDGYIFQPRFIGRAIGVHPVWLIFALYAFGSLLGFAGILLAVPLSASVGVLLRHSIPYYTHSKVYLEGEEARKRGGKSVK